MVEIGTNVVGSQEGLGILGKAGKVLQAKEEMILLSNVCGLVSWGQRPFSRGPAEARVYRENVASVRGRQGGCAGRANS